MIARQSKLSNLEFVAKQFSPKTIENGQTSPVDRGISSIWISGCQQEVDQYLTTSPMYRGISSIWISGCQQEVDQYLTTSPVNKGISSIWISGC